MGQRAQKAITVVNAPKAQNIKTYGKKALLTGVSGGIGLAVAKHLVSLGYQVFGLDIKAPKEELAVYCS